MHLYVANISKHAKIEIYCQKEMINISKDISGIYIIKNTINGKCYIGQSCHINRRILEHTSNLNHGVCFNVHLQRAWNKYGSDAFTFEVLEECDVEKLDEREIYYIQLYKQKCELYNQTDGGGGVRGFKLSEEAKAKISARHKGKFVSEEQRIKMRDNAIEWYKTHIGPKSIKVVCINTGEIFDNASLAAEKFNIPFHTHIRGCCNGVTYSCGEIDGKRLVWRNYDDYIKMTPEEITEAIRLAEQKYSNKGSNNANSKKVICLTTGEVFGCIREAAKRYNVNENCIGMCCRNIYKHAGGMEWQYYTA